MTEGQGKEIGTQAPVQQNPELKALLDLIQAMIKVNKGIITLSNILNIQKTLMMQYPILLLKFKVDRNFNLTTKMEGSPKELEALGKFLEEYLKTLMELVPSNSISDNKIALPSTNL